MHEIIFEICLFTEIFDNGESELKFARIAELKIANG